MLKSIVLLLRGINLKHMKIYWLWLFLSLIVILTFSSCVITFPGLDAPSNLLQTPVQPAPTVTPTTPLNPDYSTPSVPIIEDKSPNFPSFADIIEKIYPSVVAINTEIVSQGIFYESQIQQGVGSGWVYDNITDGNYIVTNNHVVEGANKVVVTTFDGKSYEVNIADVRSDTFSDIAVIKIDNSNLMPMNIGTSAKLRVGDWVIAVGNPLGQGIKAKQGIVSGLKVNLPMDQGLGLSDLIETSAAINPGNSGGPLVNLAGEVIGITSAKISAVGVEGMGYAISIQNASPIISQLIKQGYIPRPYLGISTVTVNQYLARVYRIGVSRGAVISDLDPNGPAAKAGLKVMDVIIKFKDKDITTTEGLNQLIYGSQIGEEIQITFVRNQETKTVAISLTEGKPQ
jgi:serine protease Do